MDNRDVLTRLARLLQQSAVKQAVQECALRRLLALLPPDQAAAMAQGLREDAQQVRENFSDGIDQPAVEATIAQEVAAMLAVLEDRRA